MRVHPTHGVVKIGWAVNDPQAAVPFGNDDPQTVLVGDSSHAKLLMQTGPIPRSTLVASFKWAPQTMHRP